jgi:hypothetical protein
MTKAQTHLIESSNSSIRDNLARFNRKSKRYSKSLDMLVITLELFFNRHLVLTNTFQKGAFSAKKNKESGEYFPALVFVWLYPFTTHASDTNGLPI